MARAALITGIAGQDGSYLAELLLEQGYRVHGIVRSLDPRRLWRIEPIRERLVLHLADLQDQASLVRALESAEADEVYNLAAQSFVPASWTQPVPTLEHTAAGVARLLGAIRQVGRDHIRFYQASSSEMFGAAPESPQRETTPFNPRSPYGVAKLYSHHITVSYRETFGIYAVSGILYNHESPRRGKEFVTRKITDAAARIKFGRLGELVLGDLSAKRDWGFAGDYVRAMWLMLQQDRPEDYCIGTGEVHTVREFAERAFRRAGLDAEKYLRTDPSLLRPSDVHTLVADTTKARTRLGWRPTVSFLDLVDLMTDADLAEQERVSAGSLQADSQGN